MACPFPGVRAVVAVGSSPTPKTKEFPRVVTSVADGAPLDALPDPTAPIAAAPFTPEESAPKMPTMVTRESPAKIGLLI
jgi:hypothetical protein